MANDNRIIRPGDYSLTKAEILSYRLVDGEKPFTIDIRGIIATISLTENIENPFMEGVIQLYDANDIRTLLPITGLERLHLRFNTPGVSGVNAVAPTGDPFYIYKIETVKEDQSANKVLMYDIHFCSKEAYYDSMRKVTKVYNGNPELGVEDIVKSKFFLNSKKRLFVEPTKTKTKMVIPNCSPVQAINLLGKKSESKKYNNSGYLFFETPEGFHYRSIESLLAVDGVTARPTKWWYSPSIKNIRNERTGVISIQKGMHQVEDWRLDDSVNILDNISYGAYSSKLIEFDPFYKTITTNKFNYIKDWYDHFNTESKDVRSPHYNTPMPLPKATFDGNKKYIAEEYDSVVHLKCSTSNTYGISIDKDSHKNLTQQSISQRGLLQQGLLSLIVPGNSLIHAGDVIEFEMPFYRPVGDSKPRRLNPQWSGRYLVASIKHDIDTSEKSEYQMTINAVKQTPKFDYLAEEGSWADGIKGWGTYDINKLDKNMEVRADKAKNRRLLNKMKTY